MFKAYSNHIRISPRKARYVADMIRGKSVNEASRILKCVNRRAVPIISKLLNSAIANADQSGLVSVNDLYIEELKVDGSKTWKRFRPGPMGRAMRIRKRTSHISIKLNEMAKEKNKKEK